MAGIHVSGGTYSGSGDITIDWFKAAGGSWNVTLPDGTMTITSESGSWAMYNEWPGSSDYWNHGSGTVKITTPAGTLVNVMGVNPSDGHFYNFIVNQDAYGSWKDPVNVASSNEGSHLIIKNNCTITSGTFSTSNTPADASELYEIQGGLILLTSGAFIQGYSGDAGFPAGFQYNSYGNLKVGYIEGQDYNGGDGVQLVLSSGTTTINSANSADQGFVFHDQRAGHVFHSSGTVRFEPGASVTQKLRWSTDGLAIYNAVVSGGASSVVKGFMSGADYLTFSNDLTIDAGTMGTYGDKLRVTGNAVINSGTLDTHTTNGTTTPHAMGSLYIKSDGTYNATAYETIINNANGDSYKFRVENGTFTHNDGTLILDASTNGGMYKNTGSNGKYLYNLIVKNDTTSQRAVQNVYDVTVANNLIVSGAGSDADDWDVGFYNAGDGNVIASGTTTVVSGAKLGRSSQNNTFGKLILGKKGWLDAGTGTTTLQGATAGSDRTKILQTKEDSLFTHNSGTVDFSCATGGLSTAYIWLDGKATADPFWNTTFNGNTGIHAYTWYKFYAGSSGVITFEGDTAKAHNGSAVFELANSSTFQLGRTGASMLFGPMNWFYGQGSSTNLIKSVDTTYPAYISGTSNNKLLGTSGDSYTPVKTTLEDIKLDDLEGELKGNLHLSGQCEVVEDLTVNADGFLTLVSGQRAEFKGQLENKGTIYATGSLLLADGLEVDGTWSGFDTADIIQTGDNDGNQQDTTSFQDKPRTYFVNMASSDTLTPKFYITNWGQKVIIGGGSYDTSQGGDTYGFQCDNLIVANGGTIGGSSFCNPTGSFSNRGGLFASSSALDLDGTDYVALGDGMATQTAVTLEAWVKPSEAPHENTMLGAQAGQSGILSSNTPNKFRIKHETVDGDYTDVDYNWVVDQWQHMCFTWDGTTGKAYANGKLLKEWALSGTPYDLTKGAIGSLNTGSASWPWEGNIARGSFWKTALTVAEIREMMFYDWATITTSSIDQTKCVGWYQFDEGEGVSISDMSGSGNTGTLNDASAWANGGTWTAGNTISSSAGNLYIGNRGTDATVFASSYFPIGNRNLISGSKFASKAHEGTDFYYVATSGTNDYMNYSALAGAPIVATNDLDILANSYFNFDTSANNNQCDEITNYAGSTVRIVKNADFYTQDFDNKGTWLRNATYDGIIHDDGSTPHEYEPIDIMDDQDSYFDVEDLID